MAGLPNVQVLLDDGSGTFPFDISAYAQLVKGYTFKRGRQNELSSPTPGDFTLALDNTDGRFAIGSTIIATPSPIKMDQAIRVKATLDLPTRTNMVPNPSFEVNTTGWTAYAAGMTFTRDTTQSWVGSASGKVVGDGTVSPQGVYLNPAPSAEPSTAYTASLYLRGNAGGEVVSVELYALPSNTQIAQASVVLTIGWQRVTVTGITPVGATGVYMQTRVINAAATYYMDAAMIEQSSTAGTYFDGSTIAGGGYNYAWTGTADASTSTATPVTANRFTHYVQSWPNEWPDGGDLFALAAISGHDGQSQAEGWKLRSIIEEEITKDGASPYYILAEPAGATSAADSSGNQVPALTLTGDAANPVVFGTATGPRTDARTAAQFAGGQYLKGTVAGPLAALEFWFATTATNCAMIAGSAIYVAGQAIGIDGSGRLALLAGTNLSTGAVNDGLVHEVMIVVGGNVYLDGVSLGTSGASSVVGGDLTVGGALGYATLTGSIAHVAGFAAAPSAARITAHTQAGSTGFAGESGTARITRLAGYANLPLGTLDTSLTNVAFEDITGKSAMEMIRDVADAEMGIAYFDGSGTLTFHNRNRVASKTAPDVTIDASFLAEGTRFEYDMQGVVNYVAVTAAGTGVTQVAQDLTSIVTNKHGKYDGSRSYLVQTDPEALDRANWTVATHKEPAARVGSLVIDVLTMTAAQQAAMLAVEPDTWLRVIGLPGQTPGGTTADFIVQGIAETMNADVWTLTLNAANRALFQAWVLDDTTYSVLDSTTRVFV